MSEIQFLNKNELMKQHKNASMIAIYLNGKNYIYKNNFGYTYQVACILPIDKNKKAMEPIYPQRLYFTVKMNKKDFLKVVVINNIQQGKTKDGQEIEYYPTEIQKVSQAEIDKLKLNELKYEEKHINSNFDFVI